MVLEIKPAALAGAESLAEFYSEASGDQLYFNLLQLAPLPQTLKIFAMKEYMWQERQNQPEYQIPHVKVLMQKHKDYEN